MVPMAHIVARGREVVHRAGRYLGIAAGALGWTGDRPLTGPLYAQISISDPCDHRCVMCEYHPPAEGGAPLEQFGGSRPGIMDLATFERLVDELDRLGTRQIDLVGRGEPLLNPRVLDMIACAKKRGFTVTMISNGSRLTGERAAAFVTLGLDRYRLSLDAALPETYAKIHVSESAAAFTAVKQRVREVSERRAEQGGKTPHVTLSFTISALNYRELVEMVETVREVGADAGHFQHCLPVTPSAESTALSDAEFAELSTTLMPAARACAAELAVDTNLGSFAAAPPAYRLDREESGPAVVPCYVGSYFTAILGNGQVMPCCQTERPIASLAEQDFTAIWRGSAYAEFRRAARRLPAPSPALATCQCDACYFRPHNLAVHNMLHPLARVRAQAADQLLSVRQLVRMSRLDH
jgi:MoaA/NifB/PqqE/SkfB family radical SAM enzyme